MHSYLASCGVDGVKVDCQAGVGLVGSVLGGGPAASRDFQAALEGSVAQHFPENHCINCMCHSTENMYRFADTAVARVSDDFYPRDAASSTPHIAACAFNSVYMGAIVQPDWDMFQVRGWRFARSSFCQDSSERGIFHVRRFKSSCVQRKPLAKSSSG